MKRIIISTKLKTTNIGNEALSNELIKLASEFQNNEVQFKIVGRPFGLDRYTNAKLPVGNPVDEFEKIAVRIANTSKKMESTEFKPSNFLTTKTDLLSTEGNVVKTEKYRRIARDFRKFLYGFILYSKTYEARLKIFKSVDYYLYSGAGEVGKSDFFFRQLLDLRVAQLMGVKTCAINQSVEFPKGLNKDILVHVYSNMHKIVTRGEISKVVLKELGVPENIMFVCPDTAFRTKATQLVKKDFQKNIGINFTDKTFKKEHVIPVIENLIKNGYKMTFVSNEPKGDLPIATFLQENYNIPYAMESLSYESYASSLSKFHYIISSRLHTNELSLTAGVPIIPIEGKIHKTREVFKFINYPVKAVDFNNENYGEVMQNEINNMEKEFFTIQTWIQDNLPNIAKEASKNISIPIE